MISVHDFYNKIRVLNRTGNIHTIKMSDLSVALFGKKTKNPLILASGILGVTKKQMEEVCKAGAGAVTAKSLSIEPRKGHETPIIADVGCGLLNAVGYSNPGIENGIKEFSPWKREEPLILSITGKDEKEFAQLAAKIESVKNNKMLNCAAIEVALSCPHTPGFGMLAGQAEPEAVGRIISAVVAETSLPVIAKLSPSVPGEVKAAISAENVGAAAINMGNTLGPGMALDIERRRPILSFKMGGLSGPAIKPVTVRCVYNIYEAVEIPVVGTGGVNSGKDAIEMMMAGASFVGVGTAVYYNGKEVFAKIAKEMEEWLKKHKHRNAREIIGASH